MDVPGPTKRSKRTKISGNRNSERIGTLLGFFMRCWASTLRYEIEDRCGITEPANQLKPAIFALWHNRIFTLPPVWQRSGGKGRKTVVLTSASNDGAILASAMAFFKIGAVRGSSSRRAVAALIGMKKALKEGFDICITPDGPSGPIYEFHAGVIKLAESSGAAIVPIHASFAGAWRLKTWDRLVIPKPFSRVHVIFDEMLVVPPKLDEARFHEYRERLQAILNSGVAEP